MTIYDTSTGLAGGAILRIIVTEQSQNTGLNQSTDLYSMRLIKGTYPSFASGITWSFTIDGTTTSGTFSFDFSTSSSVVITNGSKTVTHNADGLKTTSVSGSIGSTGTSTGGPASKSGAFVQTPIGAVVSGAVVSRLAHTLTVPQTQYVGASTEADALRAVAATSSSVTLDTLPAELSGSGIEFTPEGTALDAINDVIRTEQGAIYSSTSGTLTAPVEKLVARERTRPATVTATWDVSELAGAPEFIRDITNMVSTVRAAGPVLSATATDVTLRARAGSSNTAESVLLTSPVDLLAYAQDRLQRGANVNLRVATVTIDAMTTPTDRSADLLALKPGDRHRFTGLPTSQLGFTTWDGWLLGVEERHTVEEHLFTLFFQPVLPDTAVYDTDRYMADGALSLAADITSGATSMTVTTSNADVLLSTTETPYTLLIGSEQVTVTACTSAAPQVATITRGANSTTAAAHTSGDLVEIATSALYAF